MLPEGQYPAFPSIPRLKRGCTITEKIDGTNALIYVSDDGQVFAGSRNRWITPDSDNMGFAKWVEAYKEQLLQLGPGHHYGEWWGAGIQRRYGLTEKRFSLFNAARWAGCRPNMPDVAGCCYVVPVLYQGDFSIEAVDRCLSDLKASGSVAAPGFVSPEGVVVYHQASRSYFKSTLDGDGHKSVGAGGDVPQAA